MDTNTIKAKLILKAIAKHGKIKPCGLGSLLDGFSCDADGKLVFWFNIGANTHAVREREIC